MNPKEIKKLDFEVYNIKNNWCCKEYIFETIKNVEYIRPKTCYLFKHIHNKNLDDLYNKLREYLWGVVNPVSGYSFMEPRYEVDIDKQINDLWGVDNPTSESPLDDIDNEINFDNNINNEYNKINYSELKEVNHSAKIKYNNLRINSFNKDVLREYVNIFSDEIEDLYESKKINDYEYDNIREKLILTFRYFSNYKYDYNTPLNMLSSLGN